MMSFCRFVVLVDPAKGCGSGKSVVGEGPSSEYESTCGLVARAVLVKSRLLDTGDRKGRGRTTTRKAKNWYIVVCPGMQ